MSSCFETRRHQVGDAEQPPNGGGQTLQKTGKRSLLRKGPSCYHSSRPPTMEVVVLLIRGAKPVESSGITASHTRVSQRRGRQGRAGPYTYCPQPAQTHLCTTNHARNRQNVRAPKQTRERRNVHTLHCNPPAQPRKGRADSPGIRTLKHNLASCTASSPRYAHTRQV